MSDEAIVVDAPALRMPGGAAACTDPELLVRLIPSEGVGTHPLRPRPLLCASIGEAHKRAD